MNISEEREQNLFQNRTGTQWDEPTIVMQTRCVQRDVRSLRTWYCCRAAGAVTNDNTGVFGRLFGDTVDWRKQPECLVKDAGQSICKSRTEELGVRNEVRARSVKRAEEQGTSKMENVRHGILERIHLVVALQTTIFNEDSRWAATIVKAYGKSRRVGHQALGLFIQFVLLLGV